MTQQLATPIYTHLHGKVEAITTLSQGAGRALRRSSYRLQLAEEPDSAAGNGLYFVRAGAPRRHLAAFGTGENLWVADWYIQLVYFRGGGDLGSGDRLSVEENAMDDGMRLADRIENPNNDNYNSGTTGIEVITYAGIELVAEMKHRNVYETHFLIRWRSDVITT